MSISNFTKILSLLLVLSLTKVQSQSTESVRGEIENLMNNYARIFDQHETDHVDNIFSKDYLKSLGGKDQLSKQVGNDKNIQKLKKSKIVVHFRPGNGSNIVQKEQDKSITKENTLDKEFYFATFEKLDSDKENRKTPTHQSENWFVIKRDQDGKLKIFGTMNTEGEL